jgi:hypothetical protein
VQLWFVYNPSLSVSSQEDLRHWIWVGEDEGLVLISVFPGEAGGADLWVTPDTAEDIAKRLEDVARRVRRAFLFAKEGSDGCVNPHSGEGLGTSER